VHPTSANGDGARGSVELARIDASGLFEGVVQAAHLPLDYEIEAAYPDGASHRRAIRMPTRRRSASSTCISRPKDGTSSSTTHSVDARVTVGGVSGVRFAVWAPNARGVSVIGDFNFWDGRMHPMRSLGASGIWELFLPDLAEGARYKFEIHAADGELRVKTDPFALQVEGMPGTAAIVYSRRMNGRTANGSPSALDARLTVSRSRSMRSTSVRGGARSKARSSAPKSSASSSPPTSRTSASRTSSCYR